MEKLEMTQEQITKSVSSAFDSVNLINGLKAKEVLGEEDTASIDRNVEHLKVMMSKDWFVSELTEDQKNEINKLV